MAHFAPGSVNTAFLTTRMPSWAGVPQDVSGSTVDGHLLPPSNAMPQSDRVTFQDLYQMLDAMDKELVGLKEVLETVTAKLATLAAPQQ
ncbi:IX [Mastadenovirus eidoli]|uniref:IX n=1 Tax=Eidolon helvum adenovirus TaxID=2039267 RepID=A0A348FKF7_9ADEN|nr:IX [Eidolon helvum adenovirus]BBF72824.1 IX [Eidolon helvum adenovirus]